MPVNATLSRQFYILGKSKDRHIAGCYDARVNKVTTGLQRSSALEVVGYSCC